MNILIVANYEEENDANSRFVYLANLLKVSHNVEIVTSTFAHMPKKQKPLQNYEQNGIKFTHCYEKGYKKNICLQRFASHAQFARNVKKYLGKVNRPDIIYLAIPSLKVGVYISNYCKKNNVKFVIDVQDLWPEAFKMVLNPPIIGDIIYFPFVLQANKIYKSADSIIAVSQTYVDRAQKVNKKSTQGLAVYLGTDMQNFDKLASQVIRTKNEKLTLVYIGTLGASYTLDKIILAMHLLYQKNITDIKLIVMGDGPKRQEFEKLAIDKAVDCEFLGYISYQEMVQKLVCCDVAVNPIVDKAAASIINKVGDYAMGALPVLNTQTCFEYANKVETLNIGINCSNENIESIAMAIEKLKDEKLRHQMGQNNRVWAQEQFDRASTYQKIVQKLENINENTKCK